MAGYFARPVGADVRRRFLPIWQVRFRKTGHGRTVAERDDADDQADRPADAPEPLPKRPRAVVRVDASEGGCGTVGNWGGGIMKNQPNERCEGDPVFNVMGDLSRPTSRLRRISSLLTTIVVTTLEESAEESIAQSSPKPLYIIILTIQALRLIYRLWKLSRVSLTLLG